MDATLQIGNPGHAARGVCAPAPEAVNVPAYLRDVCGWA